MDHQLWEGGAGLVGAPHQVVQSLQVVGGSQLVLRNCSLEQTTFSKVEAADDLWRLLNGCSQTFCMLICCWGQQSQTQHTRNRKGNSSVMALCCSFTDSLTSSLCRRNLYRVRFRHYKIGQRRVDLELRDSNLITGPPYHLEIWLSTVPWRYKHTEEKWKYLLLIR